MNLLDLYEGREPHQQAIDKLEARRIEDLEACMDDLVVRAKQATTPDAKAALVKEFQKCKAERDSYFKIKDECMGYGSIVGEAGIGQDIANKAEKIARATPQSKAGAVASTVKNAAKWLAGKGGPGKEGPTYESQKKNSEEVEEGWSDAVVARRTGQPRTPYSVYIKGRKWKDFENDDHAEAVANKLRAKFKAEGRDPSVITIAPTDYDKDIKEAGSPAQQAAIAIDKKKEQGVAEGHTDPARKKLGNIINKCFGKIYDYGDDGLDYLDREAPSWGIMFDHFNGDIDTLIAQTDIVVLKALAEELIEVLDYLKSGMLEEQGVIEGKMKNIDIQLQDYHSMTPQQFKAAYGIDRNCWYAANRQVIRDKEVARRQSEINEDDPRDAVGDKVTKDTIRKMVELRKRHAEAEKRDKEHEYNNRVNTSKMNESLRPGEYYVWPVHFDDGTTSRIRVTNDEIVASDIVKHYAKQGKTVVKVDYDFAIGGSAPAAGPEPHEPGGPGRRVNRFGKQVDEWENTDLGKKKQNKLTLVRENQDTAGVESAIIHRIMVAHTDLLMKFGLEKVMQAVEEVAYNVGDVDEIGTSDVSAYVNQVRQILGA